ncbi:hypothetical protein M569_17187 [Genlisea aurea]|uniref:Uncharacterized protein n=1 Tax=Genlisea aurea TaxID=192259 RepID=S8BSR1_9LAMI|nr:hypothetical protein M569_17187 [Genlisea aurea]
MSEGLKGVSVVVTAVDDDDENGDRDSEGSSVEQQAVSSDSVICKDLSIAEITKVFVTVTSKIHKQENKSFVK